MSISEPEPWSFNGEDQFKKYESEESSTDESDDEEIFSKKRSPELENNLKKTVFICVQHLLNTTVSLLTTLIINLLSNI